MRKDVIAIILVALLALPVTALGAIGFATTTLNTTAGISATVNLKSVGQGSTLFLMVSHGANAVDTIYTATDTNGVWLPLFLNQKWSANTSEFSWFYMRNAASGSHTSTVRYNTAPSFQTIWMSEYTGAALGTPIGATSTGNTGASGTSTTSTAITSPYDGGVPVGFSNSAGGASSYSTALNWNIRGNTSSLPAPMYDYAPNSLSATQATSGKIVFGGSAQWFDFAVMLNAVGKPVIEQFVAAPSIIFLNGDVSNRGSLLSWTTTDASSTISIDQGIGNVTPTSSGSIFVYPTSTTYYTLTVQNNQGTVTSTVSVQVASLGALIRNAIITNLQIR